MAVMFGWVPRPARAIGVGHDAAQAIWWGGWDGWRGIVHGAAPWDRSPYLGRGRGNVRSLFVWIRTWII
jgi:hypothetical protein